MGATDIIEVILKWIVAPVAGFVFFIYRIQQSHDTDIAVLKNEVVAIQRTHDREFSQLQESFKLLFSRLDDIERALRK